jgi:CheY-like chemotaxis protein
VSGEDALCWAVDAPAAICDADGALTEVNAQFEAVVPDVVCARVDLVAGGAFVVTRAGGRVPVRVVPLSDGTRLVLAGVGDAWEGMDGLARELARRLEDLERTIGGTAMMALRERPTEAVAASLRELLATEQEVASLRRQIEAFVPTKERRWGPVDLARAVREALASTTAESPLALVPPQGDCTVETDGERLITGLTALLGSMSRRLPAGGALRVAVTGGETVRLEIRAVPRLRVPLGELEVRPARDLAVASRGRLLMVDGGSGVILDLPAYARQAGIEYRGASGVVLVAEDDESALAMMRAALGRAGFTVLAASNGVEGMALIRSPPTELNALVTDAVLPGCSGLELAAEARRLSPGLPVLLVSAHPGNLVGAPPYPMLRKPFGARALLDRLECVLRGGA